VSTYAQWEASAPSERLVLSVRSDVTPSSAGDGSLSLDSALGFLVSLGELMTGTNYLTLGYDRASRSSYLYGRVLPSRPDVNLDLNVSGSYAVESALKWRVVVSVPSTESSYYYRGSSLVMDVDATGYRGGDGVRVYSRVSTGPGAPYALNGSALFAYADHAYQVSVSESAQLDVFVSASGSYNFDDPTTAWYVEAIGVISHTVVANAFLACFSLR
jgi:hypothetical protein